MYELASDSKNTVAPLRSDRLPILFIGGSVVKISPSLGCRLIKSAVKPVEMYLAANVSGLPIDNTRSKAKKLKSAHLPRRETVDPHVMLSKLNAELLCERQNRTLTHAVVAGVLASACLVG